MHPLLRSREFGVTGEAVSLYLDKWEPKQVTAELSNQRLETAYRRDGVRKWGEMLSRSHLDKPGLLDKVAAVGDALLRFSAFPGTSVMLTGSHGWTPTDAGAEIAYHRAILEAIGPIVHSEKFGYAMGVEEPGNVDAVAKKSLQAEVIGALRERYPNLFFVCSTRNWSNPSDLIGYELPAKNTAARVGFYERFAITHWWLPELGLDAPVPYPLTQAVADKICSTSPRITPRGIQEVQKAVGFNKLSMEKILRTCLATRVPFLITEAGIFKDTPSKGLDDGSAARWWADFVSVCYRLGVPYMAFSTGSTQGTRNYGYGRGIGL